jgi:hypothetical protein
MIVCLDLEGVLVPEIWINVAEPPASRLAHHHARRAGLRQADAQSHRDSSSSTACGCADIQTVIARWGRSRARANSSPGCAASTR